MKSLSQIIIVVSMAIVLSACGSSSGDNSCNIPYSTTSTEVGDSGIVLEPSEKMYITFSQIERFYLEVELCMDVVAPGPTITFLNFIENGMGGSAGVYSLGTQHAYVNTNEEIRDRDCETDEWTLKHEFVHHLLLASGASFEDNINHNSTFFGICT